MQKAIETNNATKGMDLKNGKRHYDSNGNPLGGIKAKVINSDNQQIEVEMGEVIITRDAVSNPKKYKIEGTTKEILSTLNQEGGGVPINETEAEILAKYRQGGELIKRADGSYSKRGLWDNIRDNVGSGRKPTKQMLQQEAKIKEKYSLGGNINEYSVNEFEFYLEDKYNANIDLGDYKKYIYLSKISIPKEIRGLGIGTEIMNEIIAYADENNRLVTLTPSTDYGATSISRLKEFYKNFGFIENKGRNKDFEISQSMYRVPVNEKYHLGGDMSKHLAPNGKPSKLNHEQWHLVRTPEFKAWFGDWENDPENSSKVIDEETKEPLVVWHGSKSKENFNIFKQSSRFKFIYFAKTKNYAWLHFTKDLIDKPFQLKPFFLNIRNLLNAEEFGFDKIQFNELKSFFYGIYDLEKDIQLNPKNEYKFWEVIRFSNDIFNSLKKEEYYNGISFYENFYENTTWNDTDDYSLTYVVMNPNQIKLADGTNTTFDANNDDIRYKQGGSIANMTPSELKAFYDTPEGKKLDAQTYAEWKRLVNMSKSELEKFYNSVEGKKAGLTTSQAKEQGIDSGRESARWIIKMKDIPYKEWTSNMWRWAKKQINFIKRMSGMRGSLYNNKGEKTRKHTALLIWGHNPEEKFAEGGGIGDEFELELYQVRFDTDDDSEIKLVTTSYEDAKSEYEGATIGDFGDSEFSVSLEKKIDKYKFIYELDEDESIDDYPIEEYYDDSYYYELTEEGEFENIENRVITAFNSSSEDLLDEVQEWAKNKFGNYKYNTIDVYSEDDENEENDPIGYIQLRIADHSQNESNLPYSIDSSISVVIANKDATRGKFQQNKPQIYFSGEDSFDYVISEIETEIEHAKDNIQYSNKFKGGGVISQKALAVETTDLKDYVRKYFVKDGRIDVSDAMQELFGNKRGKSIAGEYRKRIGLHKKGGLTISELAHNLWEEHKDEVRGGVDDSDFREAVEDVISSEYGVSSMIKSLMEKSDEGIEDEEAKYWASQFDENEYNSDDEQLTDEEMSMIFRDMEQAERELAKGTEHEMEHLETLKKVAEGKLTPEQGVVQTASTHIAENKNYYEDLAKMEKENKEISIEEKNEIEKSFLESKGYEKTIVGLYGDDSIDNAFQGTQAQKGRLRSDISFAIAYLHTDEYSGVSVIDKDLMEWISEGFSDFPVTVFTNAGFDFHSSSNGNFKNVTFKKVSYSDFLKYKDSSETIETEQEESIPDLIEGLKVLAESLEGAEKKEIEDVIEGLEILLESDDKYTQSSVKTEDLITFRILKPDGKIKFAGTGEDSWFKLDKARKLVDYSKGEMIYEYNTEGRRISEWFEKGGEFRMKKGGNIVFKPITTPL